MSSHLRDAMNHCLLSQKIHVILDNLSRRTVTFTTDRTKTVVTDYLFATPFNTDFIVTASVPFFFFLLFNQSKQNYELMILI